MSEVSIIEWARQMRREAELTTAVVEASGWPMVLVPNFATTNGLGEWLNANVGKDHYIWSCERVWFTRETDAVMFKLRWSGEQI